MGRVNYSMQLCPKIPAKRVKVLLPSVPLRVPKGHGLNQYPSSQCTPLFQWGKPLSVVCEGRAE